LQVVKCLCSSSLSLALWLHLSPFGAPLRPPATPLLPPSANPFWPCFVSLALSMLSTSFRCGQQIRAAHAGRANIIIIIAAISIFGRLKVSRCPAGKTRKHCTFRPPFSRSVPPFALRLVVWLCLISVIKMVVVFTAPQRMNCKKMGQSIRMV